MRKTAFLLPPALLCTLTAFAQTTANTVPPDRAAVPTQLFWAILFVALGYFITERAKRKK